MQNTFSEFKVACFSPLSGHQQTYALFGTYEKTTQTSINLGERSHPLNIIIVKLVKTV
jgi:hypothetical protein